MAYLFKKKNERTDKRTVRLYYAPNFIWGHSLKYWIRERQRKCDRVMDGQCDHYRAPTLRFGAIIIFVLDLV